jgi:hypothetical protein
MTAAKPSFEEPAGTAIFPICAPTDMLAQGLHEVRHMAQAASQLDDSRSGGDLDRHFTLGDLADRRSVLALDESFDGQAATGNFYIRPVGHDIWTSAEDQVQMVRHFGVESNFHAEQRGHLLEKGMNPIASILEIPSGEWVGSAKEGPPHTPAPDVIDTDFAFPDNFSTGTTCHRRISCTGLTNNSHDREQMYTFH